MNWMTLLVAITGGVVASGISSWCAFLIAKKNNAHQLEQNQLAREWQEKQEFEKWVRQEKIHSYATLLKSCQAIIQELTHLQGSKKENPDYTALSDSLDNLMDFKLFLLANDEVLHANRHMFGVIAQINNAVVNKKATKLAMMSNSQVEATRKLEVAMRRDLGIAPTSFHEEPLDGYAKLPEVDI